jgi:hypothetical protein
VVQLERNIANVYDAFVKDGKASVALKTPEVNVFIQNGTVPHLTLFTQLLKDIQQYPFLGTRDWKTLSDYCCIYVVLTFPDIEVYAEQKKLPKRSETMEGRETRGKPKKRKTDDGDDTAMDGDMDEQTDITGSKGQQMAKSLLSQQHGSGQQPEEEQHDDDLDGFIVDEEESSENDSDEVDEEEEMERRERQMRQNKKKRARQGSASSEDEKEEDSVPSEEM